MGDSGIQINNSPKLGIPECIMIAVGGMMGSSIFTLSGVTYAMAGPSAMISWGLAGIVLLFYSMCLAELATAFPSSGGIFVYPYKVLGKNEEQKIFWGWISAWSWLNVSLLGVSFSAISVVTYLQEFIPLIKDNQILYLLIPGFWILLCFFINTIKTSILGKVNGILTLVLIIICGIYVLFSFNKIEISNFTPFIGGSMGKQGTIAAIPIAMLAYGSIIAIASIAGEIKNPRKTIPKIMSISVFLTIIVYLMILFTVYGMTPVEDFIQNPERQYFPLAYALLRNSGDSLNFLLMLVPVGAILAISTTMLVLIMDSSRTVVSLASKGLIPSYFSKINENTGTPMRALVLVSVITFIFTLRPSLIWLMINTGSVACAITVIFIAISLISLKNRRKEGDLKEGYQTPYGVLFPVLTIIAVITTLVLLYFGEGGQLTYLMSVFWYVLGIAIYYIGRLLRHRKNLALYNKAN